MPGPASEAVMWCQGIGDVLHAKVRAVVHHASMSRLLPPSPWVLLITYSDNNAAELATRCIRMITSDCTEGTRWRSFHRCPQKSLQWCTDTNPGYQHETLQRSVPRCRQQLIVA